MKRIARVLTAFVTAAALLLALPLTSYAADAPEDTFYISVGGKQLTVKMDNSTAAQELKALLKTEDLTVNMTGNSFEQYGSLGRNLSAQDTYITAQAGDVLLYNSNTICLFYAPNSYQYTRLGKIQNASNDELRELLSGDDLTITLTNKSFGEVPNTGLPDMLARYELVMVLAGAAGVLWIVLAWYKRRGEESAFEKAERV